MAKIIKLNGRRDSTHEIIDFYIDLEKISTIIKVNTARTDGFQWYMKVDGFDDSWHLTQENYNKVIRALEDTGLLYSK